MPYNPLNWYWIVAGQTNVWSSARVAYVPVSDATYQAWIAAGNAPTNIGSTAELLQVMLQQWASLVTTGGVAVQSTGTPSINANYGISPQDEINLTGLQAAVLTGVTWLGYLRDVTGTKHAMSATQFTALAVQVLGYVAAFEDALQTLVGGGTASLPAQPLTIP